MKRIIALFAVAVLAAGTAFARDSEHWPGKFAPEKTTVSGSLGISRGMITVESGGAVYYTMGLGRFVGFIDGLKAGAAVSVEGYASPEKDGNRFLWITKLTLGGKDYDVSPFSEAPPRFDRRDHGFRQEHGFRKERHDMRGRRR